MSIYVLCSVLVMFEVFLLFVYLRCFTRVFNAQQRGFQADESMCVNGAGQNAVEVP